MNWIMMTASCRNCKCQDQHLERNNDSDLNQNHWQLYNSIRQHKPQFHIMESGNATPARQTVAQPQKHSRANRQTKTLACVALCQSRISDTPREVPLKKRPPM